MKIEIWSDVMCPFCYIGKKNFENALEELSLKDKIDVEWKSFQLDPSLEMGEAITTAQYFKEKKGFPENQAKQMTAQVTEMGKSAGIDFNFEKAIITNTFPAHKLIHLAKKNDSTSIINYQLNKRKIKGDVKDFELLVSLGVFNSALMNDAVYKFKRYEDASLSYSGINKHPEDKIGLYDTVISLEEFKQEFENVN